MIYFWNLGPGTPFIDFIKALKLFFSIDDWYKKQFESWVHWHWTTIKTIKTIIWPSFLSSLSLSVQGSPSEGTCKNWNIIKQRANYCGAVRVSLWPLKTKPWSSFPTDIWALKTVYNLILFHSKSVEILTRYFLIFNMDFSGTNYELPGTDVDVKARLINDDHQLR